MLECNLIEDNDFMNTDVTELVDGDIYLFHISENNTLHFYKDGVCFGANEDEVCVSKITYKVRYNNGTLQHFVGNVLRYYSEL